MGFSSFNPGSAFMVINDTVSVPASWAWCCQTHARPDNVAANDKQRFVFVLIHWTPPLIGSVPFCDRPNWCGRYPIHLVYCNLHEDIYIYTFSLLLFLFVSGFRFLVYLILPSTLLRYTFSNWFSFFEIFVNLQINHKSTCSWIMFMIMWLKNHCRIGSFLTIEENVIDKPWLLLVIPQFNTLLIWRNWLNLPCCFVIWSLNA